MKSCPRCANDFWDEVESCPVDGAPLERRTGALPPEIGEVLGSYRLISLLGKGGMGRIYVGAHLRLKRFVAIKRLRPELQRKPASIASFFREARTVNEIKHPHIVEVIDLVDDDGGAYCVLELLSGPPLRARLAREGPLALDSAVRVAAQVADALDAVHKLGVVHRDIKPDNIILIERGGRDDYVKLIDFGVATISDESAGKALGGTAAYSSPEQAAGGKVDGRSDIYSLGVVLYEMVTGYHPFPSETDSEYLLRHADDPPPPLPRRMPSGHRKPPELERLIRRCLAKDPGDRFSSALSLSLALRGVDLEPPRRSRRTFMLAGALALSAGGAGFLAYDSGLYHDLRQKYFDARAQSATSARAEHRANARPADADAAAMKSGAPADAGVTNVEKQDPLYELGIEVAAAEELDAAPAPVDASAPPQSAREQERNARLRRQRERAARLRRQRERSRQLRERRRQREEASQERAQPSPRRQEREQERQERRSMREGVIDPFDQ